MQIWILIAGILYVVFNVVSMFTTGDVLGCVVNILMVGSLYFAVYSLYNDCEDMRSLLWARKEAEILGKRREGPQKVCPKCNKMADSDFTSCPHCGFRFS